MAANIKKVLSLDGGGIRGLAQIAYLEELERQTQKKCHELFDVIVGTSTGGLIALLLSIPGSNGQVKTAKEIKELYLREGRRIFPRQKITTAILAILFVVYLVTITVLLRDTSFFKFTNSDPAWIWLFRIVFIIFTAIFALYLSYRISKFFCVAQYSETGLLSVIAENFDESTTLKDAVVNVGVVVTDIRYRRSIVLNSWRAKMYPNDYRHNVQIHVAARATSAAPTYFKPVTIEDPAHFAGYPHDASPESPRWYSRNEPKYRRDVLHLEDGGTSTNNPARLAMIYARNIANCEFGAYNYQYYLLFIGTGTLTGVQDDPTENMSQSFCQKYVCWNCSRLDGGMDNVVNRLLLKDAFAVSLNAYHTHTRMVDHFGGEGSGYAYFRVQFKVTEAQLQHMDDTTKKNMESLVKAGEDTVLENAYHFGEMLKLFGTTVPVQSIEGRQAEILLYPHISANDTVNNRNQLKEPLMPPSYRPGYDSELRY